MLDLIEQYEQKRKRPTHPEMLPLFSALLKVFVHQNRSKEAEHLVRAIYSEHSKDASVTPQQMNEATQLMGDVLLQNGRDDEAQQYLHSAFRSSMELYGKASARTRLAAARMGDFYLRRCMKSSA